MTLALTSAIEKGSASDAGPVIACSPRCGPKALRRAIDAGVDAVIWEDNLKSLPIVVGAVLSGYLCIPSELKRRVSDPALTRREKQVLGQMVLGLSNREIAETLRIGETTVKTHVRSVLQKLGAESRSEAARMILDPSRNLGLGVLTIIGERE